MANIRVAARYAEALLTAAEEQQLLDRIAADMKALEETMRKFEKIIGRKYNLFILLLSITVLSYDHCQLFQYFFF